MSVGRSDSGGHDDENGRVVTAANRTTGAWTDCTFAKASITFT